MFRTINTFTHLRRVDIPPLRLPVGPVLAAHIRPCVAHRITIIASHSPSSGVLGCFLNARQTPLASRLAWQLHATRAACDPLCTALHAGGATSLHAFAPEPSRGGGAGTCTQHAWSLHAGQNRHAGVRGRAHPRPI